MNVLAAESTSDGVPWEAGMRLVVDIWSTEPLDLDGAVFVVIQRAARADMTVDAWQGYREADQRWVKMWNAYLAGEVSAGRTRYRDTTARAADAPPPPRAEIKPPPPSAHAEWIPGFWQRDREWIWSAGFWRVPESDVAAEQVICCVGFELLAATITSSCGTSIGSRSAISFGAWPLSSGRCEPEGSGAMVCVRTLMTMSARNRMEHQIVECDY